MHNEYFYHNEPHNDAPSVSVRGLGGVALPSTSGSAALPAAGPAFDIVVFDASDMCTCAGRLGRAWASSRSVWRVATCGVSVLEGSTPPSFVGLRIHGFIRKQ